MHSDLQTFMSSFFRLSKEADISPSQTNKQTTNQPEYSADYEFDMLAIPEEC